MPTLPRPNTVPRFDMLTEYELFRQFEMKTLALSILLAVTLGLYRRTP